MNSSANLQIFFDAQPVKPGSNQPSASAPTQGKEDFQKQLQSSQHSQNSRSSESSVASNSASSASKDSEQRLDVRRQAASASSSAEKSKPQASNSEKTAANGKELPPSGEKLPLPEETRELLASLSDEQAKELLEDVRAWLQGLNEEDLKALKKALLEGDLSDFKDLLPEDLQAHIAELAADLGEELEALYAGVQQLLASIQQAGMDMRQIASLRPEASGLRLEMLAGESSNRNTEGQASSRPATDTGLQDAVRSSQETGRQFSGARDESQTARQERLEALVARLSRGEPAPVTSRSGGESMQQLIQAASQGLGNTVTAQPAAARMAASMPVMAQVTAQANAEALANRINMMQARGTQIAEMRLDPPDLGNLRIQIRMQGDQASVILQSPNAQSRDLLENALPRLKEMLEEQGLSLADASVSDQSPEEGQSDQEGQGASGQGTASTEEPTAEKIAYFEEPLGLVDYYA